MSNVLRKNPGTFSFPNLHKNLLQEGTAESRQAVSQLGLVQFH
jgi:hypothetical protein